MAEYVRASSSGGDGVPDIEQWRRVILFGRNVASYKFALGKSLIELGSEGRTSVTLDELSAPFSRHICEHIARVDRQGTFAHSAFLDACRFYNAGRIDADELHAATTIRGFTNVIDAFHVVGSGDIPVRFFIDERKTGQRIVLTDELLALAASDSSNDLFQETEARWRLVEEAWDARADGQQVIVLYDAPRELLVPALQGKRRDITEVRPALNGYQKGHCFYCFAPIHVAAPKDSPLASDVDHFFPYSLMTRGLPVNLDSPWNLVLACSTCNRGVGGKFDRLPAAKYLERLHRRNEYLIGSHHPLRETLMLTTGPRGAERRAFLRAVNEQAALVAKSATGWQPAHELRPQF